MVRKNTCSTADSVIAEARTLAAFLIETERGKCSGDVDVAIHRTAQRWGIEEGALRSLRYRWRDLQDVRASVLENLREAYEVIYERQRRMAILELEIDRLTEDPIFEPEPQSQPIQIQEELPV